MNYCTLCAAPTDLLVCDDCKPAVNEAQNMRECSALSPEGFKCQFTYYPHLGHHRHNATWWENR